MMPPGKLEKIGRYQVLERVGKGGMGVLYRGFDPNLDREVAIKLMLADFSEDELQMRPRFYREARAAAKLQHRNIVTIYEFAEENNVPYIVMEFLRGTPLSARMKAQPPLTLDDKLNIVAQLCNGLYYAHEQGVVHRDVKPDNVFLGDDGTVKLLDFGIAKLTSSTLTRQGDVLGSASYMSPEQVSGSETLDGRSDIFSVGVLFYELLTGTKPFDGASSTTVILKIVQEEPRAVDLVMPSVPPQVAAIVMRALRKDPAERFQSADVMARELQALRKSLPASISIAEAQAPVDATRVSGAEDSRTMVSAAAPAAAAGPAATIVTPGPTVVSPGTGQAHDLTPAPTVVVERSSSALVPALLGGVIVLAIVVVAVVVVLVMRFGSQPSVPATTAADTTPAAAAAAPATAGAATASTPATTAAEPPALPPTADLTSMLPGTSPAPPPSSAAEAASAPVATVAQAGSEPRPTAPANAPPPAPAPAGTAGTAAVAAAATPARAPAAPAAEAAPAPQGPTGSLFIDYVNTFSDGEIEVDVDGHKRWTERLGVSDDVGGLAKLGISRASSQMGTELKVPTGDHQVTVTVLNAAGEVRDFRTTNVTVYTTRPMTLQIRVSRFRNQLQLDTVPGEPTAK